MTEVTSRISDEELWFAVKHFLHTEGHIAELVGRAKTDARRNKLAKELDRVRAQRQKLVRSLFPDNAKSSLDQYWCTIKHLLTAEGHLEEIIANAARAGNRAMLKKASDGLEFVTGRRRHFISLVLGAKDNPGGCNRCKNDD